MFAKNCPLTVMDMSYIHPPILGLFRDKEFLKPSLVDIVRLEPPEIKLEYKFDCLEPVIADFLIRNVHKVPLRVNILAPQSEYFQVSYKEISWLFPGLTIKAEIIFFSQEPRHYMDKIRINCYDRTKEYNVFLPLSISPISKAICDFPSVVNWGVVSINKTVDYILSINSLEEKDVVFLVSVINCEPDFTVAPQKGVVTKYDKRIDIRISYTPRRYSISTFFIHVHIPIISETPFIVKFYAACKPDCPEMRLDEKSTEKKNPEISAPEKEILVDQTIFNSDLDLALLYMDGVNKLLIRSRANIPNPNDLRGPFNFYLDDDYAEFIQHLQFCFWKAKCLHRCNDIQMIRHKPVHGLSSYEINDPQRRGEIEMMREILNDVYESRLKDNAPEYFNKESFSGANIRKRTMRDHKIAVTFTVSDKADDMWYYRLKTVNRYAL